MSAREIIEDISRKAGVSWDAESMLEIACSYIDNQGSDESFEDYVQQRADEENGVADDDEDEHEFAMLQEDDDKNGNDVRVLFTYIGEGEAEDYDPKDPEDTPLLRLDVEVRVGEDEWDVVEDGSICTGVPKDTDMGAQRRLLRIAMDNVFEDVRSRKSIKKIVDELSHLSPAWLKEGPPRHLARIRDTEVCPKCRSHVPQGDVTQRYSFGVYAGKLCTECCYTYRDACGLEGGQGDPADLDEPLDEPD